MTKGKKALIVGGIVLGSFLVFGYRKYDQAKQVLDSLDFDIKSVSRIKIGLLNVSFDTVITLINPTSVNFGATASSHIAIKEVRVYSPSGVYLGKAQSNIYEIDLPARSQVDLPSISFNLSSIKTLSELLNNTELYLNQDFTKLKYKIDVNAFGNIITLDA